MILVVALPNAMLGQKAAVGQGLPNREKLVSQGYEVDIFVLLGSPCPTAAFCPTVAFGKATTKITVLSSLSSLLAS